MWDTILQTSQANLISATGSEGKTSVFDKLHNHLYYVLAWKESEELTGDATVPGSVINRCQIYKHGTTLSFCLETVLNILVILDPQLNSLAEILSAQERTADQ